MGENNSRPHIQWLVIIQNIQGTHTTKKKKKENSEKKKKNPNLKNGQRA